MRRFSQLAIPYAVWVALMILLPMLLILLYAFTTQGNDIVNFSFTLDHFIRFFTDQGTGRLCLSIADAKEEAEADNTICLEVTVDEADKSLLLYFDRSRSKTTADRDSALFQYFKTMEKEHGNPLRIPFTLKDNRLKLKARKYFGKNDTFDLKEENHYVQTQ